MGNRIRKLVGLALDSVSGVQRQRYESRHKLLSALAERMGYRVYNTNLRWPSDEEYQRAWSRFPECDSTIHERRFNLYNLAKLARSVPGDLVECGVFRGAGSHLILCANEETNKRLHVFDSFEGLSKPGAHDAVTTSRTFQWETNDMAASEQLVRKNLAAFDNVSYYRGWIPERFGEVAERRFALVHIDVDLYQPTYDSLAFFYDRSLPAALLICDDYGSEACPGAHRAMREFFADKPESIVHLTTGQGFVVKE